MSNVDVEIVEQKIQLVAPSKLQPITLTDDVGFSPVLSGTPALLTIPYLMEQPAGIITFTNVPPGYRIAFNNHTRHVTLVPLSGQTQCRLVGQIGPTAGATGTKIKLMYQRADDTSAPYVPYYQLEYGAQAPYTPAYYDLASTGVCAIPLDVATNSIVDSGWVNLPTNALDTDIWVVLAEGGGNSSQDPSVYLLNAYFR